MKFYKDFKYWFRLKTFCLSNSTWDVIDKEAENKPIIGVVEDDPDGISCSIKTDDREIMQEILEEYEDFCERDIEYAITQNLFVSDDYKENIVTYRKLIKAIAYIRAERSGKDPDEHEKKFELIISTLKKGDFFVAPASTVYHDSYEGGLLDHTLRVMHHIRSLTALTQFMTVKLEDALLVAAVHDWCKIGLYEKYMKNVKDEKGVWQQVTAYKRKHPTISLGHGTSSMFMASKFFNLSVEEASAIRYHMGHWNIADNEVDELQFCNETYPLVHMLQFADQLSITNYANICKA